MESTENNAQGEYYFDGTDLINEDYMITMITIIDHKIIQPGEDGNKYSDNLSLLFGII